MLRHPRRVLGALALVLVVLGVLGTGVEGRLSPTSFDIPGTPSSSANRVLQRALRRQRPVRDPPARPCARDRPPGPGAGPRPARQQPGGDHPLPLGSRLRRAAASEPPPRPGHRRLPRRAGRGRQRHGPGAEPDPRGERCGRRFAPPRPATPPLTRAIQDESIAASERGELIALPILLIVLLLVFRSPVAAVIPLAFGAVTVISSRGLLYVFTGWFNVDAFALTVCTMMGLALGVDYALLMVSRFREELARGADPIDAAGMTRRTAGRTTVFAGSTLLLSMLVAFFIVPGLAARLAGGDGGDGRRRSASSSPPSPAPPSSSCSAPTSIAGGSAPPANGRSRLMTVVHAALRRPAPVAVAIGGGRAAPRRPGGRAEDGPAQPDPAAHGRSRPAGLRTDRPLGRRRLRMRRSCSSPPLATATITDPARLAALARWQRRIAALPGVQAVVGPAQVSRAVEPLRKTGSALLASGGEAGPLAGLGRLGRNLARAGSGVAQLRKGLSQASSGAGLLAEGSGRAGAGAVAISHGLATAGAGSQRAVDALETFASGSRKLASAQSRAALGALLLKLNLPNVAFNLRHNALRRSRKTQKSLNEDAKGTLPKLIAPANTADEQLAAALQQLQAMTVGQSDAQLRPGARSRAAGLGGRQRRRPGQRSALRPRIRRPPDRTDRAAESPHRRFRRNQTGHRLVGQRNHHPEEIRRCRQTPLRRPGTDKARRQQARPRLGAPRARGRIAAGRHRAPGHRLRGAGRRHLPAHRRRHGAGGKPRCRVPPLRPPAVRPAPGQRSGGRRQREAPAAPHPGAPRDARPLRLRLLRPLRA